jgi:hypothetical protein
MAKEYNKLFHSKTLQKIYPNWDFWFENIPSGNPASNINLHSKYLFRLLLIVTREIHSMYVCIKPVCTVM